MNADTIEGKVNVTPIDSKNENVMNLFLCHSMSYNYSNPFGLTLITDYYKTHFWNGVYLVNKKAQL